MIDRTEPQHDACQRHAALIAATLANIDALPPLPFDASPQGFAALKAEGEQTR